MEPDKVAVIVWFASIVSIAMVMEFTKAFKSKARGFWYSLSAILSVSATCSVWFGLDHSGNIFLLPLVIFIGWIAQYAIDMYGFKKLADKFAHAWAVKHGYEKIVKLEETQDEQI